MDRSVPSSTTEQIGELDDLEKLALCYVLGDLEGAHRDAFEERLAIDQEAREAVAGVARLTLAVTGAGRPETVAPVRFRRPRRLTAVGLLLSALAAVMVLSIAPPPVEQAPAEVDAASLLDIWSQSRVDEFVTDDEPESSEWETVRRIDGLRLGVGDHDEASDAELEPPDWMLAAVSFGDTEQSDVDEDGESSAKDVDFESDDSAPASIESLLPSQTETF